MDVIKEARREERAEPPLEITEPILARLRPQNDPLCPESLDHTRAYRSHLVAKWSQSAPRRSA